MYVFQYCQELFVAGMKTKKDDMAILWLQIYVCYSIIYNRHGNRLAEIFLSNIFAVSIHYSHFIDPTGHGLYYTYNKY